MKATHPSKQTTEKSHPLIHAQNGIFCFTPTRIHCHCFFCQWTISVCRKSWRYFFLGISPKRSVLEDIWTFCDSVDFGEIFCWSVDDLKPWGVGRCCGCVLWDPLSRIQSGTIVYTFLGLVFGIFVDFYGNLVGKYTIVPWILCVIGIKQTQWTLN